MADQIPPTILPTIRTIESGNNYGAKSSSSSASGAYQIVDATWNNYGGFKRAVDAPPDVQDAKARLMVIDYLTRENYFKLDPIKDAEKRFEAISKIPVYWYYPKAVKDQALMDKVPPFPGNTLTPRQYQAKWVAEYQRQFQAIEETPALEDAIPGVSEAKDVINSVQDALAAIVGFIGRAAAWIASPSNWLRIAKVIGGVMLGIIGLYLLAQSTETGQRTVEAVAK